MERTLSKVHQNQFRRLFFTQSAVGGFIIRDWTGKLIKAEAAHYGESSILVVDARALRDGVEEPANARFTRLFIERDNATVVRTP